MKQSNEKPDTKVVPADNPSKQGQWPEDDIAEKLIKSGGKKESPSKEDEEEEEQQLKEQQQPKK